MGENEQMQVATDVRIKGGILTFSGMMLCPRGEGQVAPLPWVLRQASTGGSVRCFGCRAEHDAWDAAVAGVSNRSDLWHAAGLAGGTQTTAVILVRAGERVVLDLKRFDIPADAHIHRIIQTPYGEIYLLWLTQVLGLSQLPDRLVMAAVPFDASSVHGADVEVSLSIAWSPASVERVEDDLLLSAAIHFADGDLKRAVLDAHTATDLRLREAVIPELKSNGLPANERLGLLQRLSVLETLAGARQEPALDVRVREGVQELHRLRNGRSVAHGPGPLTESVAATGIAASLVLAEWVRAVAGSA